MPDPKDTSPSIRLPLPKYDGEHSKYVEWASLMMAYLVITLNLVPKGSPDINDIPKNLDATAGYLITSALSGKAARKARKLGREGKTGARDVWYELQRDFQGAAKQKKLAARAALEGLAWPTGGSVSEQAASFRESVSEHVELIEVFGGTEDFEFVQHKVLMCIPDTFDSARDHLMAATDTDTLFDAIEARAHVLDGRRGHNPAPVMATPEQPSNTGAKSTFKGRCFTCNEVGHRSSQCPEGSADRRQQRKMRIARPCRHCGEWHLDRDCKAKALQTLTSSLEHLMGSTRSSNKIPVSTPDTSNIGTPPFAPPRPVSHSVRGVEVQPTSSSSAALATTAAALLSLLSSGQGASTQSVLFNTPVCAAINGIVQVPDNHTAFIVDGACTAPLVNDPALLKGYRTIGTHKYPPFVTGTGETCAVDGVGRLDLLIDTGNGSLINLTCPEARYCSKFKMNLMPESTLVEDLGLTITYDQPSGKQLHLKSMSVSLRKSHGLHWLDAIVKPNANTDITESALVNPTSFPAPQEPPLPGPPPVRLTELHKLFGHRNYHDIAKLAKAEGWQLDKSEEDYLCETCAQVKSKRRPQRSAKDDDKLSGRPTAPGSIVSVDYIGKFAPSIGGHTGAYVFIDWFSKMPFVYLVSSKDQFLECLQQYQLDTGLRRGDLISGPHILQSDTSSDIYANKSVSYCRKNGIRMRASPPAQQGQNGMVERAIRTLKEMTRAMLASADLPEKFWGYALKHAALIISMIPRSSGDTPYVLQFGVAPENVTSVLPAPFGSPCIVNDTAKYNMFTKLPGEKGIYVGNSNRSRSYCIYMTETQRIRESDSVIFLSRDNGTWFNNDDICCKPESSQCPKTDTSDPTAYTEVYIKSGQGQYSDNQQQLEMDQDSLDILCDPAVAPALTAIEEMHEPNTAEETTINYAVMTKLCYDNVEACKKDPLWETRWKPAHEKEMAAMIENDVTTDLVPINSLAKEENLVDSKMLYSTKHDKDNSIIDWKGRLVAKGFSQRKDIDYFECFAPTPNDLCWRLILFLAARFSMKLKQFDVSTAFLNGNLSHPVYMRFPRGMRQYDSDGIELVARLSKTIYGLKQSGREWNERLTKHMMNSGYSRSQYEPCLFFKRDNNEAIFALVYVDDILVTASSSTLIDALSTSLQSAFKITGGQDANWFLGMSIERDMSEGSIKVSQENIIDKLANDFPEVRESRKVKAPLPQDAEYLIQNCPSEDKADRLLQVAYRKILGTLMYVAVKTRPDCLYAVARAARVMSNPGEVHYELLYHTFRYMYHTKDKPMKFMRGTKLEKECPRLICYTDSDWARDKETRQSVSGFILKIDGNVLSYKSKAQKSICHSSTEAETIASSLACKDIVYTRRLLAEIGFVQTLPTILMTDSGGAIFAANNPQMSQRMKHIAIADLFGRLLVDQGVVQFTKVNTLDNQADILTKPIVGELLIRHRNNILGIG